MCDTTNSHLSLSDPSIDARIERYKPKSLTAGQATAVLSAVKDLVRRADLSSWTDARVLLATACRFVADETALGHMCDVDVLFTEARVAGWSHREKANGANVGTLQNDIGRLHRLVRVHNGLPARMRVASKVTESVAPLSDGELDTLHAVCTLDAWRAVVACVSVRASGRQFVEGAFSLDGSWFHTANGDSCVVLPRWRAQAAALGGVKAERRHWDAARAFGKTGGVELSIQRAARTFGVEALSVGDPFNTLIVEYSLTRRVIDRSYRFLPVASDETCRALLRGTDWL